MAHKQTKAQQILAEARERLQIAENAVHEASRTLSAAEAMATAHREAYNALEVSLAPKQRASPKPREAKEPKKSRGSQSQTLLTSQATTESALNS